MSISALARWIVGSLNWSATDWTCFKAELLWCVRGGSNPLSYVWKRFLWFTPVYFAASAGTVWAAHAANGDCSRLISKIYNFCSSVLFHLAANVLWAHLFFAWLLWFINIHPTTSNRWFIWKQKYGFFGTSQLGFVGSCRYCYRGTFIASYFSIAPLMLVVTAVEIPTAAVH